MPRLICLHGFLGGGADWEFLRADFPDLVAPNLEPNGGSFAEWTERFCSQVVEVSANAGSGARKPILLGYSMGARLAMQAIVARPDLFAGAVLISGNPGLKSPDERHRRLADDETWARRFESENWDTVLGAWNSQAVFKRSGPPFGSAGVSNPRDEGSRESAVRSMRAWSLGRQEDLLPRLAKITLPILWVAGEFDEKFVSIGRESVPSLAAGELWIAPGAGHRVPWEAPDELVMKVKTWIAGIR